MSLLEKNFDTDVLVVGGGPAGLAVALAACRKGMRVRLVDAAHPPIDKPGRKRLDDIQEPEQDETRDQPGQSHRIEEQCRDHSEDLVEDDARAIVLAEDPFGAVSDPARTCECDRETDRGAQAI